jgi:hypothetical protein
MPLDVPDDAAGKRTSCAGCKRVFKIPPPLAPEESQGAQRAGLSRTALLAGAASLGVLLMFLSFFLPWWGVDLHTKAVADVRQQQPMQRDADEFSRIWKQNDDFYKSMLSDGQRKGWDEFVEAPLNRDNSFSTSLFGWDFARGIVTFVLSILAAVLIASQLLVPVLRRGGFALLLSAAALGLVVFILALTVWAGTPGEDSGQLWRIAQGVSAGPILALFGGVVLSAAGGAGGAQGLMGLLARGA